MRYHRNSAQEDLFDSSRSRDLQRRVKELDSLIARAMRQKEFDSPPVWRTGNEGAAQNFMKSDEFCGAMAKARSIHGHQKT